MQLAEADGGRIAEERPHEPAPRVVEERPSEPVPRVVASDDEHVIHDPPTLVKRIALLVSLLLVAAVLAGVAVRVHQELERRAGIEAEREAARASAAEAPSLDVVHPSVATLVPHVVLSGTLEPVQSAGVGFGVPGRIARVEAQLGEVVRGGDVLATLDRASIGAQASASQAAVGVAEANVAMLEERIDLLRSLVASGAAPERDLTAATQQLAVAQAQVRQAQAGSRAVSTTVADYTLRAPFDGVVTRVPNGIGQVVGPGVPLFQVEDLSVLRLRTTASERELDALAPGMAVELEGLSARGTVTSMVRSLDPQTRRAPVEVTIANPDGRLVAHALVRARVRTGASLPALRIPASARRSDGAVLVVSASGRVEARAIDAEADTDGSWLVPSGLSPSELVVLRPAAARVGGVVRANLVDASPASEGPADADATPADG